MRHVWDSKKNDWLKKERNLCFEKVEEAIDQDQLVDVLENKTHPGQYVYLVRINGYIHAVPFKIDGHARKLLTVYPSRKLHKKYGGRK